ncbi:MAG: CarD family transcriptional regulator [Clostridiales bacterium]|nr:CarD family transcriptional regulator [Clostridiales bacterium]
MFMPGDLLCYPMHGVGMLERVEEQTILGESARYYVLRFLTGKMTAMVPVSSAEKVGLRPLADAETCRTIISFLRSECMEADIGNWNQRYRDNMDKLKSGDIYIVAGVVKSMLRRELDKGLSTGERKMFLTARQILLSEISAVLEEPEEKYMPLVSGGTV